MWTHLPLWAMVPDSAPQPEFECHSCGQQTSGYTMAELMVQFGWRLHGTRRGKPCFTMCGDCEKRYAERWTRSAA